MGFLCWVVDKYELEAMQLKGHFFDEVLVKACIGLRMIILKHVLYVKTK